MTTTEQTVERLRKLYELLDTFDPHTGTLTINGDRAIFAMDHFSLAMDDEELDRDADDVLARMADRHPIVPDFCETAACALGSAGLHPWFQDRGLRSHPECGTVEYQNPRTGAYEGLDWTAGARFFGITQEESHYLFGNYPEILEDVTADQVKERVEELLVKYKLERENI